MMHKVGAAAILEPIVPTYSDIFFEDVEGIVGVYDFDYDQIINFKWDVTTTAWCLFCCVGPILSSICCEPCFAYKNIEWSTRAQHAAIHQDGIKYVVEKRKAGCGFQCQDEVARDGISLNTFPNPPYFNVSYPLIHMIKCYYTSALNHNLTTLLSLQGKNSNTIPFDKVTDCDVLEPAGTEVRI